MLTQALLFSGLVATSVAQLSTTTSDSGSAQTTISAFGIPGVSGFAASISAADNCHRTLIVSCTDSDLDLCSVYSGEITVTEGPSTYQAIQTVYTEGATGIATNDCKIYGPSASPSSAVCTVIAEGHEGGVTTTITTTTTFSGSDVLPQTVPVTAGAEVLQSATGSCTTSGNVAAATALTEVYKVLVPVGAALMGAALV